MHKGDIILNHWASDDNPVRVSIVTHICKKQNSYPIAENADRCVSCGTIIPEGRMMCSSCEKGNK